jgi:hypothetical protein
VEVDEAWTNGHAGAVNAGRLVTPRTFGAASNSFRLDRDDCTAANPDFPPTTVAAAGKPNDMICTFEPIK